MGNGDIVSLLEKFQSLNLSTNIDFDLPLPFLLTNAITISVGILHTIISLNSIQYSPN